MLLEGCPVQHRTYEYRSPNPTPNCFQKYVQRTVAVLVLLCVWPIAMSVQTSHMYIVLPLLATKLASVAAVGDVTFSKVDFAKVSPAGNVYT